jgi:hypothetical protein
LTAHEPSPEPRVGQEAYVPSERYLNHGRDDFSGGLCEIIQVTRGTPAGSDVPFVEFKERPGYQYNWNWLMELQPELRKRFGAERGRADPDLRPEFNRDWEESDA